MAVKATIKKVAVGLRYLPVQMLTDERPSSPNFSVKTAADIAVCPYRQASGMQILHAVHGSEARHQGQLKQGL